jgi:hypothetical protein
LAAEEVEIVAVARAKTMALNRAMFVLVLFRVVVVVVVFGFFMMEGLCCVVLVVVHL